MFNFLFLGYIDPGGGLPFFQLGPFIIGGLIAFLGTGLLFIKRILRFFIKHKGLLFLLILVIISLLTIGIFFMPSQTEKPQHQNKTIVIGFDGLEPKIIDRLIVQGKLPNFKALKDSGTYSRLATTIPPESLVAWTSFATGSNPGKHGVYDFIKHDPKTYMPSLAFSDVVKGGLKKVSKGTPFWKVTRDNKINTVLIHCPNTFPPDEVYGKLFSGMGVPDIRGTMGTFTFYTTAPLDKDKDIGGKVFSVTKNNNVIETFLPGPYDISGGRSKDITIPLKITVNDKDRSAFFEIAGKTFTLREKSWSKWCELSFKINFLKSVRGICRFYLKGISPEFELYASPVNFDPRKPAFSISWPHNYSKELAGEIGLYHTLGMPHDTWALNEGRIDEEVFLQQAEVILTERRKMLELELERFDSGVLFCYFGTSDSIQHTFWRFIDPENPMHDPALAEIYKHIIGRMYIKMDTILGDAMKHLDENTTLIVLSDHGFTSFRRAVHLNSWLRQNGFLYLKDDSRESGAELFQDVDWMRTKAYSLGFGEIFINTAGREGQGILTVEEAEQAKNQIIKGLSELKDPATGASVVRKVYRKEQIYRGPYVKDAPDLIVGFNEGYRASWQTAIGGVPKNIIEDNNKRWAGGHLMDASVVPGIFFINRKITRHPRMIDMAPTILDSLGVDKNEFSYMDGESLL